MTIDWRYQDQSGRRMAEQGQSMERLREYLRQLPPQAQALLMREFERAIERGDDVAVATFVLQELRKIVRPEGLADQPRGKDCARSFFRSVEPFLVDHQREQSSPGQIRRSSLIPIWTWIGRDLLVEEAQAFECDLGKAEASGDKAAADGVVRRFQMKVAEAMAAQLASRGDGSDRQRILARIGSPTALDDLSTLCTALRYREALDALKTRLPNYARNLIDDQFHIVRNALDVPTLQTPQVLPLALSLVMRSLSASWQLIRLATAAVESDDAARVASSPYSVAVAMVLNDLVTTVESLRDNLKRGRINHVSQRLKGLHDALRGLRTELDIRPETPWGKQLAQIRKDISSMLRIEIELVPGRVRRLLRQRADKDVTPGLVLDATDVMETAALIEFVGVCKTYASELAINEITLRTYSDIQQYLERTTEALLGTLRSGDARSYDFRQSQVNAAIRFCSVMFGEEYASLMTKAADVARASERKAARQG